MTDTQLLVVTTVAVLLAGVLVGRFLRRRRRRAWRHFAGRHALRPVPSDAGSRDFVGTVGGRSVALRQADRGSDSGELGVAVVTVSVGLAGELPDGLRIEPGTPLDPLLAPSDEELPAELAATGDEAFDARVRVRAADPDAAMRYLSAERRRAVLDLLDEYPSAYSGVRRGRVQVAMREVVARADHLEDCLEKLLAVATVLDAA